jgi:cytoplasmic iron level regulating protein YaaA (DUF328/UPF0246 family)
VIFLLSPAKTLDFETPLPPAPSSRPRFLEHSKELVQVMQQMSVQDLEKLLGISTKLATLNAERFQRWKPDSNTPESRQAIFAFKGGVYQGLAVEHWSDNDLSEAQQSLRILSGLYGVLRPLDLIFPYRLEMGKKIPTARGTSLYQFWGDTLTDNLNEEINGEKDAIINLASKEYFSAINQKKLTAPVITPVFKDQKNGKLKVISFYAKKARGQMAAWAIQQKTSQPEELKAFKEDDYVFNPNLSDKTTYTFTREER